MKRWTWGILLSVLAVGGCGRHAADDSVATKSPRPTAGQVDKNVNDPAPLERFENRGNARRAHRARHPDAYRGCVDENRYVRRVQRQWSRLRASGRRHPKRLRPRSAHRGRRFQAEGDRRRFWQPCPRLRRVQCPGLGRGERRGHRFRRPRQRPPHGDAGPLRRHGANTARSAAPPYVATWKPSTLVPNTSRLMVGEKEELPLRACRSMSAWTASGPAC